MLDTIGNPTDKRVWYFLNHWYQRVGRCVLLNHHEWRECNDRNEWWFSRTHRPTSWLKWFRKYHTSLRWDFLLIQGLKPWIIRFDFSLIQGDFRFRVWYHRGGNWYPTAVWYHRRENWYPTAVWYHRWENWYLTAVWYHRRENQHPTDINWN